MTPPSVKMKSSGEREKSGSHSNSSRVTVPPTTVRVVSMTGAPASLTIVCSAASAAGRSMKSIRTD